MLMHDSLLRAENEARTRDPNLGKVVLYQLSYFRVIALYSVFKLALPRLSPFFLWGKVVLYQLSYFRKFLRNLRDFRLRSA